MVTKRYHVSCPEELKNLERYAKEQPNNVRRMADVWACALRRNNATRWDNSIYVRFSGDRKREAVLYRIAADGEVVPSCTLNYNLALRYCQENLRQVFN